MNQILDKLRITLCLTPLLVALLGGCASKLLTQQNPKLTRIDPHSGYRYDLLSTHDNSDSLFIMLSFSGGGTRAASLAFGVLEALREHEITWMGQKKRVLDEIDVISSVSGGSFTAAYFGLFGDRIFDDFEKKFLKRNVEAELLAELVSPRNLLRLGSPYFDRIHIAAEFYDREIFDRQTYKSLIESRKKPYVVINATDLGLQSRFEFTQPQFDKICYDLSTIPVSVAVAASSAYPVWLSPMTLENQWDESGCGGTPNLTSFERPKFENDTSAHRTEFVDRNYRDYKNTKYLHLVDGGISDNLGLGKTTDAISGADSDLSHRMEAPMKIPSGGAFGLSTSGRRRV